MKTSLVKTPTHKRPTRAVCFVLGALLAACERPATSSAPAAPREALSWSWMNPLPQGEAITAGWVKSAAEVYFASSSYLLHTRDSGETWEVLPFPRRDNLVGLWGEDGVLYARAANPYQGQDLGVLWTSRDGGKTWQEGPATAEDLARYTPPQSAGDAVYYEATDKSARYTVEGYHISLSRDGGVTQRELSAGGSYVVSALSSRAPAIFPVAPGALYAVNESAIVYGSLAGGAWVKSAGAPLSVRFSAELCAASDAQLFCYDKQERRVLQLEDGKQLAAREASFGVAGLAVLGERLIARQSDGLLWQSLDQGASWQEFTLESQRISAQRMWSLSPSSLYLRVERQLWYTEDGGASWKKVPFLFLPEASLFAGQGTLFVITGGEVYFLSGNTWDIWRDSLQKARFTEERAEGIFFVGDEVLVATTLKPSKKPSSNRLLRSQDNGLTWRASTLSLVGSANFNYDEQRVWVSPSREVLVFGADLKGVRGIFHLAP